MLFGLHLRCCTELLSAGACNGLRFVLAFDPVTVYAIGNQELLCLHFDPAHRERHPLPSDVANGDPERELVCCGTCTRRDFGF